jgi:hypothetical protein
MVMRVPIRASASAASSATACRASCSSHSSVSARISGWLKPDIWNVTGGPRKVRNSLCQARIEVDRLLKELTGEGVFGALNLLNCHKPH